MARRRLLIDDSELRTLERPGPAAAPIAHLAGEAAAEQGREIAKLREAAAEAAQLKVAEAEGRVLADVPLDLIDPGFLARDRILPAETGGGEAGGGRRRRRGGRGRAGAARLDPRARAARAGRARGLCRRGGPRPALWPDLRLAAPQRAEGAPCRDRRCPLRDRARHHPARGGPGAGLRRHGRGERDPRRPLLLRTRPDRRARRCARAPSRRPMRRSTRSSPPAARRGARRSAASSGSTRRSTTCWSGPRRSASGSA